MNKILNITTSQTSEMRATFLVVMSAILYGFLGFFGASLINLNFSVSSMLFWRFTIAAAWMAMTLLGKKNQRPIIIKTITPYIYILLSAICYSMASLFYFLASGLIGTGIAMVIYFAYPIFVVIMMMLKSKQWIDRHTFVSLVISFFGLLLLKGNSVNNISSYWGVFYALAAAFSFAGYVIISKRISNTFSSNVNAFILCLSNALIFLVISLVKHEFTLPNQFIMWVFAVGFGVIATAIPIQLLLEGLKTISASKASILSALEPAVTLFVGMLLLSEPVSHLQMLGASLILLGAAYVQFQKKPIET